MMQSFLVILTAVVALSAGQRKYQTVKPLKGTTGQSITLDTHTDIKPSDDLQIMWSFGSDDQVLVNFENGNLSKGDPEKFLLDLKTGALTILSLSAKDAGLYTGQIHDGGNGKGPFYFNLTVGEAERHFGENPSVHQRNHYAAFVSAGLFVLTCILLLAVLKMRKCQSKSPSPQTTAW